MNRSFFNQNNSLYNDSAEDLFPLQHEYNTNQMQMTPVNTQPKKVNNQPPQLQKNKLFQKKIQQFNPSTVQPIKHKIEKRYKKYESSKFKILSIGVPRPCIKYTKKRFEIEMQYQDKDNKKHKMTIAFGNKFAQEYIDHKDKNKRSVAVSKLQHGDNPFHANFYKINLLNGQHTNIFDNFKDLCVNNNLC